MSSWLPVLSFPPGLSPVLLPGRQHNQPKIPFLAKELSSAVGLVFHVNILLSKFSLTLIGIFAENSVWLCNELFIISSITKGACYFSLNIIQQSHCRRVWACFYLSQVKACFQRSLCTMVWSGVWGEKKRTRIKICQGKKKRWRSFFCFCILILCPDLSKQLLQKKTMQFS